ncbi:MAG: endolytic transglycosylase MltG, partial [Clostridia bacterium]
ASMIQAEARFYIDYESVSYVFWNRLNHVAAFPFLQSDATIQYVLPKRNEDLTQEDLDLNNPYNTYVYKGLPPGAICNPGFDALSAAIYPDAPINSNGASVNAYFFVSNKAGVTYYAETKAQHEKNKRTVAEDNVNFEKHNN